MAMKFIKPISIFTFFLLLNTGCGMQGPLYESKKEAVEQNTQPEMSPSIEHQEGRDK